MAIGDDQQNTNDGVRVEVQETNKTWTRCGQG